MENKPLNILVSCYACGPNWGSEIGMGWHWVINLSNYCQLYVITEIGFKEEIEKKLATIEIQYKPKFYYNDIGEKGRELFWIQGSFRFYKFYRKWQKKTLTISKEIIQNNEIQIIHQLNMIGFREPGYLYKVKNIPFIWGPVGGYHQFPLRYVSLLNFRDKLFYLIRSFINVLHMHFLVRPKKAYRRASTVILATPYGEKIVSKYTKNKPVIIAETGAYSMDKNIITDTISNGTITLSWVGLINGRKALPIALRAISKVIHKDKIILNVVGDGPNIDFCKNLAKNLGLKVHWHGKIPNVASKKVIASSDMLFFTSVLDATSTVVFEALEASVPVLCHDSSGFGKVIDATCGIKIPLKNVKSSVDSFSKKIDYLVDNPKMLINLKKGCKERIKEFYWDEKAKQLYTIYKKCLEK